MAYASVVRWISPSPAVDGVDRCDDVYAGCQAFLDEHGAVLAEPIGIGGSNGDVDYTRFRRFWLWRRGPSRAFSGKFVEDVGGQFFGAGKAGVAGDDGAVVAHANPSASTGDVAVAVDGEVHGAFGLDVAVHASVPAHEGLAVPDCELTDPVVAAFFDGSGSFG